MTTTSHNPVPSDGSYIVIFHGMVQWKYWYNIKTEEKQKPAQLACIQWPQTEDFTKKNFHGKKWRKKFYSITCHNPFSPKRSVSIQSFINFPVFLRRTLPTAGPQRLFGPVYPSTLRLYHRNLSEKTPEKNIYDFCYSKLWSRSTLSAFWNSMTF